MANELHIPNRAIDSDPQFLKYGVCEDLSDRPEEMYLVREVVYMI